MKKNLHLGKEGEDAAVSFLTDQGFNVVERNYRAGRIGEIDIIAKNRYFLLFVEVKNRRSDKFGGAHYSITASKSARMKRVASHYLQNHSCNSDLICRFDLLALCSKGMEWVQDICR